MVLPIASPIFVPAVVIDCSSIPPDAAGAAAALDGGAAAFFAGAGALLEDVRSTAPSVAEPAALDPKEGKEPIRLEKEFEELPVPAPEPLVKLLIEGRDGKDGKDGKMLEEDFPFEVKLELLPKGPEDTSSIDLMTWVLSVYDTHVP